MDSEDLRLAVYQEFAATGRAADAGSLAARFGTGVSGPGTWRWTGTAGS